VDLSFDRLLMMTMMMYFCFLFCVFYVFVLFCVLFILLCCVFPIFVQVYLPVPPCGNPTAVNKYRIYHIISYISYRIVSYRIIYHITPHHSISYHISYHTTSQHIISYIISHHITAYHIIYHIISYKPMLRLTQPHTSQVAFAYWLI